MNNINPVDPQANVALSLFDSVSDDTSSAFLKYNRHQHNPVIVPSFTATDIKVGDVVYVYDSKGRGVFFEESGAYVEFITPDSLRLTKSSVITATNTTLYYRGSKEELESQSILGVDIEEGSQLVRFSSTLDTYSSPSLQKGRSGFLSVKQSLSLQREVIRCEVALEPERTLYYILPHVGIRCWLRSVYAYTPNSINLLHIEHYSHSNPHHSFSNPDTWSSISPALTLYPNARTQVDCMPTYIDELDFPAEPPPGYPTQCLLENDLLAARVSVEPTSTSVVFLTLVIDRIL